MPEKKVMHSSALSPQLLNVYLDEALLLSSFKNSYIRKNFCRSQMQILIMANEKKEAEEAIEAFKQIESFGLRMKVSKT